MTTATAASITTADVSAPRAPRAAQQRHGEQRHRRGSTSRSARTRIAVRAQHTGAAHAPTGAAVAAHEKASTTDGERQRTHGSLAGRP